MRRAASECVYIYIYIYTHTLLRSKISQVLKFKIKAALKDRQSPILWPRPT